MYTCGSTPTPKLKFCQHSPGIFIGAAQYVQELKEKIENQGARGEFGDPRRLESGIKSHKHDYTESGPDIADHYELHGQ